MCQPGDKLRDDHSTPCINFVVRRIAMFFDMNLCPVPAIAHHGGELRNIRATPIYAEKFPPFSSSALN